MTDMIIDCGTTNLRVTMVEENGDVLSVAKRPGGVRNTAVDGHNGKLKAMLKDAMEEALSVANLSWEDVKGCYAYGMITSNVGLLEVPHLVAPVAVEDMRNGIQEKLFPEIAPLPIRFIPGVRNAAGKVDLDNYSSMDMMRGEEVESVGLWNLLKPEGESVLVLPGSHNKFVRMDAQGRILGCMTSISGELLDALTNHTIIADAVGRVFVTAEEYDATYAEEGARECLRSGIGRASFSGRILNQLGGLGKDKLRSYILGVVLAQDMIALQSFMNGRKDAQLIVAGKEPLQTAISDIAKCIGWTNVICVPKELSEQMGLAGVKKIITTI